MNNRERVLEFDFRPRVDESTDEKVRFIAAREGVPPNVLIRTWILEAIRRDEAIRKRLTDEGLMFRRVTHQRG